MCSVKGQRGGWRSASPGRLNAHTSLLSQVMQGAPPPHQGNFARSAQAEIKMQCTDQGA